MSKCYRCDISITAENETDEHIILNACGGRLKSKHLLCATCNSIFGSSFDRALAEQTNVFSNLLSIERERGEPQSIKGKLASTGEEYYLLSDGNAKLSRPVINKTVDGNQTNVSIRARDEKELRQIIEGYKRKNPQIDIGEIMKNAKITKKYFDEPLDIKGEIGGDEIFKSIAKSAVSFFIYKGGESKYIKHLIPYLDAKTKLDIVWIHYPEIDIYTPTTNEVSHIIRVIGTNEILYAYIELFNVHKYIIKINENYTGSDIDESYVYDVFERKEISRNVPISYSKEKIVDFLCNKNAKPFQKVQDCYARILTISDKRQTSIQVEKLVDITLKKVQEKYQNGVLITKKVLEDTMNEVLVDRGQNGSAQQNA